MFLKLCCAVPFSLNCLKSSKLLCALPQRYVKLTVSPVEQHNFCTAVQQCRWVSTTENKSSERKKSPLKRIYHGLLSPHVRAVKLFSISSSIVGVAVQPILYKEIMSTGNVPIILACYSFISFFTVITPVLLHTFTKKYVMDLYYNADTKTYIAKTLNIFCVVKQTEFKLEDVHVPEIPGMFESFRIKGKSFMVDPRNFEDTDHYAKLMGYDKPMDFKLFESVNKEHTTDTAATTSGNANK